MDLYSLNLSALRFKAPAIAARLDGWTERKALRIAPSKDGSVAYAMLGSDGKLVPLTDPNTPISRIQQQLDAYREFLSDLTRPIMVVGFYPGNELLYAFDLCEKAPPPHAHQPLWVYVDSLACLEGFLRSWDARRVILSPRVKFLWHEDAPLHTAYLLEHPESPHVFTLLSCAPDHVLDRLMPLYAEVIETRRHDFERVAAMNELYYEALSDEQLARVLSGRSHRKPRLLAPTVSWSSFAQHSTRDICAAFEEMGWETRVLKVDTMLTPYFLAAQICEFKPDVFLFIDHLRHEAEAVYPRNMMFLSWIQDEQAHIQTPVAGMKLRAFAARSRRDLLIGCTEGLASHSSYPADRLIPLDIAANPALFHPVQLSPDDIRRYGCQIAFMSDHGFDTVQVLEQRIAPLAAACNIPLAALRDVHHFLQEEYRAGRVFTDADAMMQELMRFNDLARPYNDAPPSARQALTQHLFDDINAPLAAQAVVEWAHELDLAIHLYGQGWENHPRFLRYAKGPIPPPRERNIAFQAAALNLHLTPAGGLDRHIRQILAAHALPLVRTGSLIKRFTHMPEFLTPNDEAETAPATRTRNADLLEWLIELSAHVTCELPGDRDPDRTLNHFTQRLRERILECMAADPRLLAPAWDELVFTNRHDFESRVARLLPDAAHRQNLRKRNYCVSNLAAYHQTAHIIKDAVLRLIGQHIAPTEWSAADLLLERACVDPAALYELARGVGTPLSTGDDPSISDSLSPLLHSPNITQRTKLKAVDSLLASHRVTEARRVLKAMRRETVQPADVPFLAGNLLKVSLVQDATTTLEALPAPGPAGEPTALVHARLLRCRGDREGALQAASNTLALYGRNGERLATLAEFMLHQNRATEAAELLGASMETLTVDDHQRAALLCLRAQAQRSLGRFDEALSLFSEAGEGTATWIPGFEKAMTLRHMNRPVEAAEACRSTFEKGSFPDNPCGILHRLISKSTATGMAGDFSTQALNVAESSLAPWLYYSAWCMLVGLIHLRQAPAAIIQTATEEFLTAPFLDRNAVTVLREQLKAGRRIYDPALAPLISRCFWPRHAIDSYEHRAIQRELSPA